VSGVLLRRLALAAVLVPAVFALVTLRTLSRGEAELAASDRAFDSGQLELAVRSARRAAAAYVPGAGHVEAAYARLRAVARGAERSRDLALARSAWQAMRVAAVESGHLWRPHARELQQANANLARLSAASAVLPVIGGPPDTPRPAAALLLAAGFSAMLGSLLWLGSSAWTASGRWQAARARWPALGWCLGVGVLAWALLHA
jgi:hypothetical protein